MKLDWDCKIPDNLQPISKSHFQMKYQQAVILECAIDSKVETLHFGDASRGIACIAIYARFERKYGSYSYQLVFARARLIPTKMTQPRAGPWTALINTDAWEVVRRPFGRHHTNAFTFTDNQIVLHLMSYENLPVKQCVRNK